MAAALLFLGSDDAKADEDLSNFWTNRANDSFSEGGAAGCAFGLAGSF